MPFLATLQFGCPGSICVSQQLLFLYSKHFDTMANVTVCDYGKTNYWLNDEIQLQLHFITLALQFNKSILILSLL